MFSRDPVFPLYPVCACVGFVLCLVPLPWHIQAWNSGTCAFMIWTALECLILFINSLIWAGNVANPTPVWCDIASKFIVGASVGIPAAILCISRRLYTLTHMQTASLTRNDKRRMVLADLAIAAGIPFVIMSLHYIIQPHRFDIIEDIGCYPAIFNAVPAYFLYSMWPIVLGVISFGYSAATIRSFWLRRAQFMQLVASHPSMSVGRYFRLLALALVDMTFTVPLGLVTIVHGVKRGLSPWVSWEDTHYNFSRVVLYRAPIWHNNQLLRFGVEFTRWLPVFCAFVFFALFGFASEARKTYVNALRTIIKSIYPIQSQEKEKLKEMMGNYKSDISQGLKPLKLAGRVNTSVAKFPPISAPVLVASSNPSVHALIVRPPTKSASQASQLHTIESRTTADPSDTSSISTSIYAQSCDLMPSYRSCIISPVSRTTQISDEPPQLPKISLSPPLSTSPPPSPASSVPESVGFVFYKSPAWPGCLPSPVHHRPFCGPSVYPVSRPYPNTQQGIAVTIHRQASVDDIV